MKLKLLLASVGSGIFLSLPWLGFPGIVLLFAFIPLFWVEDIFLQKKNFFGSIVFWQYALITFFVWNVLTTWWIWIATPLGACFAVIVNSLLMSIVWWLFHMVKRTNRSGFSNIFFVFAWISFEYLHYHWELAWPWLSLGNGFANDVMFIQWYEYTGVFGGTLWVLCANIVLWSITKKLYITGLFISRIQLILTLCLLLIPILLSFFIYYTYSEKESPVNVLIAQPNIDPYEEKFNGLSEKEQYDKLLYLCDSLNNDQIDFFIGPETAIHNLWLNQSENEHFAIKSINNFLNNNNSHAAFILGAMSYKLYQGNEQIPATARLSRDGSYNYDIFNSAMMIDSSGLLNYYHKSKLVAGVERIPYERYFNFLSALVIDMGGASGTLASSIEPVVFKHNQVNVGVPICYESVFGEYVSGFIQKGAEVLFVITNDGWWKNTPGYKQHLNYSKILAVEFRRSIARSGNTGISCIINQRGQILNKTQWWQATAITGTLNANQDMTFYAKTGDYIARVSLFMFVLMAIFLLADKIKNKQES